MRDSEPINDPRPVVLFDGHCNFCNDTVRWAARRDPLARLRYAPLRSAAARRTVARADPHLDFDALPDAIAVDLRSGLGRSHIPGPVGPTPQESFSGLVDTSVSVTWRVVDELVTGGAPSVAIRAGVIAAGGYETGHINSLGDGGNGFEGSVVVGKFGDRFGASGEVGYRARSNDIPSDTFINLAGFFPVNDRITIAADYRMVNGSDSGLDIGGPGFSPDRFPELQEDAQLLGARVLASVNDSISVSGFFGQIVGGRNTAASRVIGLGVTYSFITE